MAVKVLTKQDVNKTLQRNYDRLCRLSEEVTSCAYGRGIVQSVERTSPMTAIVTLEVDMSAGETLHMFPGNEITLSSASRDAFSRLESYYLHEESDE